MKRSPRARHRLMPWLLAVLVLGAASLLVAGRAFPTALPVTAIAVSPALAYPFDPRGMLSQSFNNCAPYSASALIQLTRSELIDPETLANETTWRIVKGQTLPYGLMDLLTRHGVKFSEFNLGGLSDRDKVRTLREYLGTGRPVILLGKIHGVQHYLTLVGYDPRSFFVYNSLMPPASKTTRQTQDTNAEYPGNETYSNQELLDFWAGGGAFLFFRSWGLAGIPL